MNKKILMSMVAGILLAGGAMAIPVLGESPLEGVELRGEFKSMLVMSQDPSAAADGASASQPQGAVSADSAVVVANAGDFLPLDLDVQINGSVVESSEPVAGVPTPSTMALVLLAPAVLAALTVRRRRRR